MKQKFQITLEVMVDPNEISGGIPNGDPSRWYWESLLRNAEINAEAMVKQCFIACCEAKIDFATDEFSEGEFAPYLHDEDCVNYEPIEEPEED